ncbi:MAG TPA: cyclodeaminase/cyclohydrolase family protein [Armatimonadota bacterium]
MILESTLDTFLEELASSAPTPGGGSSAALLGALGAALVSMVCNLTLGKEKYAGVQAQAEQLLSEAERLRARLTALVQEDVEAFGGLSAAYKLPRLEAEQKRARSAAIQRALLSACEVPLETAEACSQVLALCKPAAEIGNSQAVSDAGVAAASARAGLESAALNVEINLSVIKDEVVCQAARARLDAAMAGLDTRVSSTLATVRSRL